MAMIVCSVASAALVLTRVSPPEIDTDDVAYLPEATSTFVIHLGMVPMSDVASGVLTPNQNSVVSSNVPYTTPADSTIGMAYPSTSVFNQIHLLSKVFPLEQDNDTNCAPPFSAPNCVFETPLSATGVPAELSTPVHPVIGRAEEPCAPTQVCTHIQPLHPHILTMAGLARFVYCILRGCTMLPVVSFL